MQMLRLSAMDRACSSMFPAPNAVLPHHLHIVGELHIVFHKRGRSPPREPAGSRTQTPVQLCEKSCCIARRKQDGSCNTYPVAGLQWEDRFA